MENWRSPRASTRSPSGPSSATTAVAWARPAPTPAPASPRTPGPSATSSSRWRGHPRRYRIRHRLGASPVPHGVSPANPQVGNLGYPVWSVETVPRAGAREGHPGATGESHTPQVVAVRVSFDLADRAGRGTRRGGGPRVGGDRGAQRECGDDARGEPSPDWRDDGRHAHPYRRRRPARPHLSGPRRQRCADVRQHPRGRTTPDCRRTPRRSPATPRPRTCALECTALASPTGTEVKGP